MSIAEHLTLGFSNRRMPVILQTEAAESGLACIGMVAGFHGYRTDLAILRGRHPISLKGSSIVDLSRIADQLQLASRPVTVAAADVGQLQLPCVLRMNGDHYVVLKKLQQNSVVVHDPAIGVREVPQADFRQAFSGAALELWPNPGFQKKTETRKLALRQLMGKVPGLYRSFAQVLLLAAALEVFTLVNPFYLQWVVDHVIVSEDRDLLTTLAVGFGLLMLLKVLVGAVRSWLLMHIGTIINVQWRANAFAHLLHLPIHYFQKRHLGDVTSRFSGIDHIQNTLTTSFVEALIDGLMSIVTLIMMLIYSRVLSAIAVVAVALYGIFRWTLYNAMWTATRSQIVYAAKQQTHFLESVRGVRTIKQFQGESQRRTAWLSLLVDQINASLRTQKLQTIYDALNGLLTGAETILIIWYGARMILDGDFTVGALMAFKAYDDQFSARTSGLVDKAVQYRMLRVYGERLADIVLTEPERSLGESRCRPRLSRAPTVCVTNVRYRYGEHEPFVLSGVTFLVSAGESVVIVGPSGCGKTTLLNILIGALPPTSGSVEIDGLGLQQLGPDGLRELVGTVMQDDVLFAGSIKENICFFDPSASMDRVEECARFANIHEDIVSMPMGYHSLVGDMGAALSGGQKQRVLLARALFKQPKVLVLDEATSQLDVESERRVSASLKALDITRIVVAHRPETIASAGRVLMLEAGQIRVASEEKRAIKLGRVPEAVEVGASPRPVLPRAPAVLRFPSTVGRES